MIAHLVATVALGAIGPAPASPYAELYAAMPSGVHVEAALTARDLHQLAEWTAQWQVAMQKGTVGRALLDGATQKQMWGFDWAAEMSRFAKLAQPDGKSAPAALVLSSMKGEALVEMMIKVAPGFEERLAAAMAAQEPPPWRGAPSSKGLAFSWGKHGAGAVLGADGWLRISPDRKSLTQAHGRSDTLFSADMQRRLDESDVSLFFRAGGLFERKVVGTLANGVLRGLRAMAVTWKTDGDRTTTTRLLIDADGLAGVRPMVRDAALTHTLVRQWDKDATALVSVALPRHIVQSLVPMAQVMLADGEYALPPALVQSLAGLSGQAALVSFGSPGDWALALEMTSDTGAASVIPALGAWLSKLKGKPMPLEALPPLREPVLHLRPDPALAGMRVAQLGPTVVFVATGARLSDLERERRERPAGFLAGPLTPPVRAALEQPSILSAYAVLGTTDTLFELMSLYGSALEGTVRKALPPELGFMSGVIERMPLLFAAAGFRAMLAYDLAVTLDLNGSIAALQIVTSDI